MPKKSNSKGWFIPVRGSYLPNRWQGWLSYVPFTAFLVFAFVVGIQTTSSLSQAVLYIVPNWIAATVIMTWVARLKSS